MGRVGEGNVGVVDVTMGDYCCNFDNMWRLLHVSGGG